MNELTDFETDLHRIDKDIAELLNNADVLVCDGQQATRYAYRLYQRASLTGNFEEFGKAELAINAAMPLVKHTADLYFLKASLDFKLHRNASALQNLEKGRGLRQSRQGRVLEADLHFQEGEYGKAEKAYHTIIQEERTWDNIARLAYLKGRLGETDGADRLYREAESEITAKEMRSYAWVELQRGLLKLMHGSYDEAGIHYRKANKAYSGYWLVDEHVAELLGAKGQYEEAILLYKCIVEHVAKPELFQAIGELYILQGNEKEANVWCDKALAAYLSSAEKGEVHYYHHLADFYNDVRENGSEAVKWAGKDAALRNNFATQAQLAWAYYRNGQFEEAKKLINQALSSGVMDAQLYYKAAMIHFAVGEDDKGNQYLKTASNINPHYDSFHVHH